MALEKSNLSLRSHLISSRHEHRLLGLLLISLYLTVCSDFSGLFSRGMFLIHIAIFLIWQSSWIKNESFTKKDIILFSIIVLGFTAFLNLWFVALWQLILISLFSERRFAKPRDYVVNFVAIAFLIALFLTATVSHLFSSLSIGFDNTYLKYSVLLIPCALLLIAADNAGERFYSVDFFRSLIIPFALTVIMLGSVTLVANEQMIYPIALLLMVCITGLCILFLCWLWTILSEEKNFYHLWQRSLPMMDNSFEKWLNNLAQPQSNRELNPEQFLRSGFEQLLNLPWVSGIVYLSPYGECRLGDLSKKHHATTIKANSIEATIYAKHYVDNNRLFHIRILIQLLEHFHQAKRRERAFAEQAHLQAIYETGAKLTHDIKNLLQSLHAIASVIQTSQPTQFGTTQRMLQGQIPHLVQRLKSTLDKLQKPTETSYAKAPLDLWWDNLQARYRKMNIDFLCEKSAETENIMIPEELFDSVAENLLQNVLSKRKREPDLQIKVTLTADKRRLNLLVCDNGTEIPSEIANQLFSQPVSSRDGYGIGLYQLGKQVSNLGFSLKIDKNVEGRVCFRFSNAPQGDDCIISNG